MPRHRKREPAIDDDLRLNVIAIAPVLMLLMLIAYKFNL
jgi:hypothetical protein